VSPKRFIYQLIGQIGLLMTIPKLVRWAWRLRRGPIEVWDHLPRARIPMIDARTWRPINWAIETRVPEDGLDLGQPSTTGQPGDAAPEAPKTPLPALHST
jgi:hypothetical protein